MSRRKNNLASKLQTNLPLNVEEKIKLSPDMDLLTISVVFNLSAHSVSCLLSMGHLGLAVHSMREHPRYRTDIEKLFPGIVPPFFQMLELKDPKLVSNLRKDERKTTVAALYAAALIYSHAVLEDVLVRLCELSIKCDPQPWLAIIGDRKVAVRDVISKSIDDVKTETLARYMKDFERFTLLDKYQTLLGVLRPKTCRRVVSKYIFSLTKLKQLDALRHDMVHRRKFAARTGRLYDRHDYLLKTAKFFITLTQRKYDFKPLPSVENIDFEKLDA